MKSASRRTSRRSLVASPPTTRMARPGPRERLAPDQALGQPELGADGADLVLEQRAQRLDELELEVVGQAADVVVGLDRRRAGAAAGLDDVGVQRALHEEARVADLRRLLLEDADELGADDLALALGLGDAAQLVEEARLGVDGDERDLEGVAEGRDDLLALVLAHQPVVDEDARELVADRAVHEQRRHRRVDAAAQPADDLAVADLVADARDLLLDDRRRRPRHVAAADVAQEALEDVLPVGRVDDLGVELDAVDRRARRTRRPPPATRSTRPARVKPGGGAKTVSRCDIQQLCSAGRPASSRPCSRTVSLERPNSPTSAPSTRPPSLSASSCMP